MTPAEEESLRELFGKLDVNKDGKVDMDDLNKALHDMQVPQVPGHAEVIIHANSPIYTPIHSPALKSYFTF